MKIPLFFFFFIRRNTFPLIFFYSIFFFLLWTTFARNWILLLQFNNISDRHLNLLPFYDKIKNTRRLVNINWPNKSFTFVPVEKKNRLQLLRCCTFNDRLSGTMQRNSCKYIHIYMSNLILECNCKRNGIQDNL